VRQTCKSWDDNVDVLHVSISGEFGRQERLRIRCSNSMSVNIRREPEPANDVGESVCSRHGGQSGSGLPLPRLHCGRTRRHCISEDAPNKLSKNPLWNCACISAIEVMKIVVDNGGFCADWELLVAGVDVVEFSCRGEEVVFRSLILKLYLFYFINFKIRINIATVFNRHFST